ncbi:MAG: Oxygen-independent coproporphyrinogen-III oxidase-like protein HemZ [Candidatus Anoxychlamydiales bacterium]|nr:Oxygen-independent coproporphyrinogen-III oxidase-like protein HemZ [Candidatus Anoxychlamydiales bacterium]
MKKLLKFNEYLRNLYGCKVFKVSIDANFTCPNRDGTKSKLGCIYCDPYGSSSRVHKKNTPIKEQLLKNIEFRKTRYKAKKFIAYFQSFSNTYASLDKLKLLYDEAIYSHIDIVGLSISTRSDCIDEEKVKLIASYRKFLPFVSIELGLQSMHDKTLSLINRKETLKDFIKAYELIKKYNLHLCVHVILGLPGETKEDMLKTASFLAKLKIDGIKLHLLIALKNTVLEKMYLEGKFKPLTYDEYVDISKSFISKLDNNCIIHKLAGSGYPKDILAPRWIYEKKLQVIEDINC